MYTLKQISNFLKTDTMTISRMLSGIPGFEAIYKHGGSQIIGFKLPDKNLAIESLRKKLI